jgi:hypothetical protein
VLAANDLVDVIVNEAFGMRQGRRHVEEGFWSLSLLTNFSRRAREEDWT